MISGSGLPAYIRADPEVILGSLFVNYRRNDSEGEAGRLFDELEKHFGEQAVFMDVSGIEPGQDFRKAIDQSIGSCSALLAVIGPHWLDSCDSSGQRRLDDPGDFVRTELASALRSNIPVVPVLVRGSKMPRTEDLPADLKELAYRNAVELTHARWKSDIQVLVRALRPHMGAPAPVTASATQSKPVAPSAAPAHQPPVQPQSEPRSVSAAIDTQTMDRASRQLARYLGPIANVIVKRAAQRAATVDDLFVTIAREIGSDADRASFLRSCRS